MKRALLLGLATLAMAGTANAEFNYTFLQGSYGDIDFDDFNADGDVLGIDGSYALTTEFHLFGGLSFSDLDQGVDATSWGVGFGYNTSLTPTIDIIGRASFQGIEVDTPFGDADDTGFGLGVGLRIAASDLVELNAGIDYVDLDDSGDNTAISAAALFNVTERVTLGIGGSFDDDVDIISVSARLYF